LETFTVASDAVWFLTVAALFLLWLML
jgi:hypothetical protein